MAADPNAVADTLFGGRQTPLDQALDTLSSDATKSGDPASKGALVPKVAADASKLQLMSAKEQIKNADAAAAANKKVEAEHPYPNPNFQPFKEKPPERSPGEAFGSLASMIGILFGMRTRTPLTSALNASAAAMEGLHAGDMERYNTAHQRWKDDMETLKQQAEWEVKARTDALETASRDMDLADRKWKIVDAVSGNVAASQERDWERRGQIVAEQARVARETESTTARLAQDQDREAKVTDVTIKKLQDIVDHRPRPPGQPPVVVGPDNYQSIMQSLSPPERSEIADIRQTARNTFQQEGKPHGGGSVNDQSIRDYIAQHPGTSYFDAALKVAHMMADAKQTTARQQAAQDKEDIKEGDRLSWLQEKMPGIDPEAAENVWANMTPAERGHAAREIQYGNWEKEVLAKAKPSGPDSALVMSRAAQLMDQDHMSKADALQIATIEAFRIRHPNVQLNETIAKAFPPDRIRALAEAKAANQNYPLNTWIPPGQAGNAVKAQVEGLALEIQRQQGLTGGDIAGKSSEMKAVDAAYKQTVGTIAATSSYMEMMDKNIGVALDIAHRYKIDNASSPLLSLPEAEIEKAMGSPAYTALRTALFSVTSDFARIQTGGSQSIAQTPQGAMDAASKLLNETMPTKNMLANIAVMKADSKNKMESYIHRAVKQEDALHGRDGQYLITDRQQSKYGGSYTPDEKADLASAAAGSTTQDHFTGDFYEKQPDGRWKFSGDWSSAQARDLGFPIGGQ